jgi:hypothetical protein
LAFDLAFTLGIPMYFNRLQMNNGNESPRRDASIRQLATLLPALAVVAVWLAPASASAQSEDASLAQAGDINRLFARRKEQQVEAARKFATFHEFQFTDRWAESGIRFEHHVVDDAAKLQARSLRSWQWPGGGGR